MENSKIQWTNNTHNFWMGCRKVSEGCKFCYMHRILEGKGLNANIVHKSSDNYFRRPLLIKKPSMYFTCSMSDFFIEEADKWREEAWDVIKRTPWHTWQILTKRPERIRECLPDDWGEGYKNVWLGVTIETQKHVDRAIILNNIPSALRFISAEPLLEEIDFLVENEKGERMIDQIHWVILGGESGYEKGKYKYRPCKLKWIYKAVEDLKSHTSAKVFVKQLGTHLSKVGRMDNMHGDNFSKFPKYLQVREIPTNGINHVGALK